MSMLAPEINVSTIHFLVHPGFLGDIPAAAGSGNPGHRRMFDGYLDQAQQLGSDGIVFAMLHKTNKDLLAEAGKESPYAGNLRSLRSILDRRLITVSADYPIEEDSTYMHAQEVANTRGYQFNTSVQSVAYGEVLGACVEEAAQTANRALGLRHRTVIRPDVSGFGEHYTEDQLPLDLNDYSGYDRIVYQLPRNA